MSILVGFAPGKDDRSPLALGAVLARSAGVALKAVTAVPAPWPTPVARHADAELEQWSKERGAAAVAEVVELAGEICPDLEVVASWVPSRSVSAALLEAAGGDDVTALVVGSGRGGGYGRIDLSSSADRLLHSSPVPLALAPRGYQTPDSSRIGRATCAFRGDEASRRTLTRTAAICREQGVVLRVATFAVRGRTMYPPEVGLRAEDMITERWVEQSRLAQAEAVSGLAVEERPAEIDTVVASGAGWDAALDRLRWERDDLLVVGSSTSGVLQRLFLGSSGTKIVRASPVPVLVIP